jgi:hypothetical protein
MSAMVSSTVGGTCIRPQLSQTRGSLLYHSTQGVRAYPGPVSRVMKKKSLVAGNLALPEFYSGSS